MKQHNFKVGDRVRVVKPIGSGGYYSLGATAVIDLVDEENGGCDVVFDHFDAAMKEVGFWVWNREIELIEPAGQSRKASAVESTANIAVGIGVALATQYAAFPLLGIENVSHAQHFALTAVFTAVSFVRSYSLRRAFNWLHAKGILK